MYTYLVQVNTASRLESNGESGRIHVSESTAELLIDGGKSHWLTKRPDLVKAKGKGDLQTYWVTIKSVSASTPDQPTATASSTGVPCDNDSEETDILKAMLRRYGRDETKNQSV